MSLQRVDSDPSKHVGLLAQGGRSTPRQWNGIGRGPIVISRSDRGGVRALGIGCECVRGGDPALQARLVPKDADGGRWGGGVHVPISCKCQRNLFTNYD